MKRKKYEIGKLYKLTFYDHSVGSKEKMVCEAVGWCIQDDPIHVVLTAWNVKTNDEDVKSQNVEPVSILKAVIINSRKYS